MVSSQRLVHFVQALGYLKIGFSKHKNVCIWVLVYNVFPGEPDPHPFLEKSCLDTLNTVGGKINFLILLKGTW